jgi:phospholipid/cholesterol/gamma-HCH transport system permease protein
VEASAFPAPSGARSKEDDEDDVRREPPPDGPLRAMLRETGDLVVFAGQTFRAFPGTIRYFSEVLRQTAIIVRRTSLLMLIMNMFLGFSVANFGFFFLRSIGGGDAVGIFTGLLTQRQVSMTMFGYVIAASVCCGFAAELGAATIQQEIDAYSSTGVDPRELIVGTRVLAVILYVPIACAISLIGQLLGNYTDIVVLLQGNSSKNFLSTTFGVQSIPGQIYALVTFFFVAIPCAIVGCFYGMRTKGGPAAVGTSVSRSLVVNLVLVHVITAFFGVFFYGRNLQLPIGA